MRQLLKTSQLHNKAFTLLAVLIILSLVIVSSTFRLQVVEGQQNLKLASANNRISEIIRAPRGLIYDLDGRLLVNNDPAFNVYVIPSELKSSKSEEFAKIADELAALYNTDAQVIKDRYQRSAFTTNGQIVAERVTIIYNISYEQFLATYDSVSKYAGVYISTDSKRTYIDNPAFTHILGYVGDINAQELNAIKDSQNVTLDPRSIVGKDGLEKIYDQALRGEDGVKYSQRSAVEDDLRSWVPKSYKSGDNIYLTIDYDWQTSLYKYLEKYSLEQNALGGAAMIMEADTGKVRSLVNYPSYDLNLFAKGISTADFNKLLNDNHTPLLNRAVSMQIPTGSVFKVVMGTALLQEGVVGPQTVYKSGCVSLGKDNDYTLCEADKKNYGTLNLYQALARSSNPYFCQAVVDMAGKLGSDTNAIRRLGEYFDKFGLGKKSGIDLPGEQPGTMPSPELKLRLQKEPWYLADLCNTAIGQGLVSATPTQMLLATAAILNGGKVLQPTLVEKFEDADYQMHENPAGEVVSELGVDKRYLEVIKEGMKQATEYGTATGLKNLPGEVYAKTGSSEVELRIPEGVSTPKDCINLSGNFKNCAHSWITGSFTKDGKQYVFVVALQLGGRGYKSLPVISDFIKCLDKNFTACE